GSLTIIGAQGDDYPGLADVGSAYIFGCAACPAITINPAALPNGRAGALYGQTLTASGGVAPYTFSIWAGALPPGLSLASNGKLTGVPSATGTYTFTVRALADNICAGTRAYTLTVTGTCPLVTINPSNPTLPTGTPGLPYNQTFTAAGATA